jgi:hypothetical protein
MVGTNQRTRLSCLKPHLRLCNGFGPATNFNDNIIAPHRPTDQPSIDLGDFFVSQKVS